LAVPYAGPIVGLRRRGTDARADHTAVHCVTFTGPEVVSAGLSEAAAAARSMHDAVDPLRVTRPVRGRNDHEQ